MKTPSSMCHSALVQEKIRHEALCRRQPGNFQTWWNLARINLELGHAQPALAAFEQALALKPRHLEILIGKILACIQLERLGTALETVESALAIAPGNSDLLLHQAFILQRLGKSQAASSVYERILALPKLDRQKRAYALSVSAALLVQFGQFAKALERLEQGLALAPTDATLLANRAALLIRLRRYEEGLAVLDKLPPAQADEFAARCHRLRALVALRRFEEAEAVLGVLRERYPLARLEAEFQMPPEAALPEDGVAKAYTVRGLYLANFYSEQVDCDWRNYAGTVADIAELVADTREYGSVSGIEPFRLLSLPIDPALPAAVAKARAGHIARLMEPLRRALDFTYPARDPGERLRIGYVCADFRDHPTAHLTRRLFQVHDRNRFEILGYSLSRGDESVYWHAISAACDRFTVLAGLSNQEAARRIAADGVHILVDLHGHVQGARLEIFALRPAPIQATYLAYPGTTGADFIHYVIADRIVLPEAHLARYSEQPVFLPECYQVNDSAQPVAETGVTRAAQGLPEEAFVYCCFNATYKIDPGTFAVWMEILAQTPDSVLWLLSDNEQAIDNLRAAAQAGGIDPRRLVFASRLSKAEHLERLRLADLFLDTFIYNAHTTASDALWAGLPVVTLCGETFPARVCTSLLFAIGLPELITYNREAFAKLAVSLAKDWAGLAELRSRLSTHRLCYPLFDTERFTRHLERAYEMMWRTYVTKQPLQPLVIQSLHRAELD